MGNTKSNTAIITEDWVDVDIDDSASEYDSEEEEDMECDGKLLRSHSCIAFCHWHLVILIVHLQSMLPFAQIAKSYQLSHLFGRIFLE